MWVPDEAAYVLLAVMAVLFSVLPLMDEADIEDPDYPTYVAVLIRRPVFCFMAFVFWAVWGAMGLSINNCDSRFAPNQCFTNFTQQTVTAVISPDSFAGVLSLIGYLFAALFFVLFLVFCLVNGYVIARHGYLAKRRPAPPDAGA